MTNFSRGALGLTFALASAAPLLAQSPTNADSVPVSVPWANHLRSEGGPRLATLRLGIAPDTLRRRSAKAIELSDVALEGLT